MRSAVSAIIATGLMWAGLATAAPAAGEPASREEVKAAVARIKSDPDMPATAREKTLRLKDRDQRQQDKPSRESKEDLGWIGDFVRWVSETARLLVWLAAAIAVAFLLVGLRRWVRTRAEARLPPREALPSHVRSLDIRPESLPDEIGVAAAALWQQGEHHAALSLLYRGALSRLVHVHSVPIRAASTEGECVALAQARLEAKLCAFVSQLVGAWQLAVYGARLPEAALVLSLCREFDLQWRMTPTGHP